MQYTLAGLGPLPTLVTMVGGYLICNILCGGVEAAIFGSVMVETIPLAIPAAVYPTIVSIIVAVAALKGVDIFAKLQDFVSYLLLFSMIALGLIGAFQLGTGAVVAQPAAVTTNAASVVSAVGVASWLFVGAEYAIPISKDVRNANRNIPLGMMISLALIWRDGHARGYRLLARRARGRACGAASPHLLYGEKVLGNVGKIWNERGLGAGLHRLAELHRERALPDLRRHDQGEHDAPVLLAQEPLRRARGGHPLRDDLHIRLIGVLQR